MIRINRPLRTRPKRVSDEMLAYLMYHELLHHLLPIQGNDAEFRDLESLWPGAVELDYPAHRAVADRMLAQTSPS